MPPYLAMEFDRLWWIYGIGLALALLLVLIRGSRRFSFGLRRQSEPEAQHSLHEFAHGLREGTHPVPIYFWTMCVCYIVWSIGYVLFSVTGR
jgi:hypothetical protein